AGFRSLQKLIDREDWVVMEASGPYYLSLASYLYSKQVQVVVENPLVVKRYSQMKLYRAKTDKKDARTIAEYAEISELKRWEPNEKHITDLKQIHTAIEGLQKQLHQSSQQLEAFKSSGALDKYLEKEMKRIASFLQSKITNLEKRQEELAKEHFASSLKKLTSIPGIGNKTAIMLIVITNDFQKFDHYKKLIAYVGFSPRIYQSGTSIKGKGHICKMGKAQIRKLLYICTWSAKRWNKACKEMYERLAAKGKPERVIKIALANKLIKQAFAIAKSDKLFDENYQSNICF
ncbi:MAG: IS110 family transposase, partial [Bacteroidota bacterium]